MAKIPHPDYFEGILQIRGGNDELIEWIQARVKEDDKAAITKIKDVRGGLDLYVTDQHYLQNLGRKLQENFAGVMKISQRIFTTDKMTSKHVYRVTVLFRPLPFKKGDIVTYQGDKIEILGIGKKVRVRYVETNKKAEIVAEKLEHVRP